MENKPVEIIYLVQDMGEKDDDGRNKGVWRKIGAMFNNKSGKGHKIQWDFEPVPTNGRVISMPPKDKEPEVKGPF